MKVRVSTLLVLAVGVFGLGLVYVFQRTNYASIIFQEVGAAPPSPNVAFMCNKILRLVLNDLICIFVLFRLFTEKSFRQIAMFIFVVELVVILPLYFVIKLNLEGASEISTPLLSFMHRLVVNPTLMVLTGVSFAYQKFIFPILRKP
jgi:exosortase F-associated protein